MNELYELITMSTRPLDINQTCQGVLDTLCDQACQGVLDILGDQACQVKVYLIHYVIKLVKVYLMHYVIKLVSDLQQVGGFLRVLRFPPPIKRTAMTYLKYY